MTRVERECRYTPVRYYTTHDLPLFLGRLGSPVYLERRLPRSESVPEVESAEALYRLLQPSLVLRLTVAVQLPGSGAFTPRACEHLCTSSLLVTPGRPVPSGLTLQIE